MAIGYTAPPFAEFIPDAQPKSMIRKLISKVFGGGARKAAQVGPAVLAGARHGVRPDMLSSA